MGLGSYKRVYIRILLRSFVHFFRMRALRTYGFRFIQGMIRKPYLLRYIHIMVILHSIASYFLLLLLLIHWANCNDLASPEMVLCIDAGPKQLNCTRK